MGDRELRAAMDAGLGADARKTALLGIVMLALLLAWLVSTSFCGDDGAMHVGYLAAAATEAQLSDAEARLAAMAKLFSQKEAASWNFVSPLSDSLGTQCPMASAMHINLESHHESTSTL